MEADYTFSSEGVTSIRQIAFKLDGHSLFEGYGETEATADRVIFRNIDSLKFNYSVKLSRVACL